MYPQRTQQPVQGMVLKCPNCGAPLDMSPDDAIAVCKYCGQIVRMRGEVAEVTVVRVRPKGELEEKVQRTLRSRGATPTPENVEVVYLPFYFFRADANGTVYRLIKTKNGVTITTEHFQKRGIPVVIYGRYGEFLDLDRVIYYLEKRLNLGGIETGAFVPDIMKDLKVLGVQKDHGEAYREAKERAELLVAPMPVEGMFGKTRSGIGGTLFYDAVTEARFVALYYYPLFLYTWKDGKKRFVTIADGATGDIIVTKVPIKGLLRNIILFLSIASPFLFGMFSSFLPNLWALGMSLLFGVGGAAAIMRGEYPWTQEPTR